MKQLSAYTFPLSKTRPYCSSVLWAGAALLMSTPTHISYMTLDGHVRTIVSLDQPGTGAYRNTTIRKCTRVMTHRLSPLCAVLMAVLNDKVVLANSNRTNTEIRTQPIGLLEPLVCGQLAYAQWRKHSNRETAAHLASILSRFDCLRVSDVVYTSLQAAGYADAAASLLAARPSPPSPMFYSAAISSLRFELALSLQKEKKPGVELPPVTDLGRAAVAYGQFETGKQAFELGGDFLALLQLYASCGNKPGVEQLLERAKKDEALKHYVPVVERVLKVRVRRLF